MATFQDKFINTGKAILIPSLQRDYVQGGRADVINPFLDELIRALRGGKAIGLNYIYGYDERFNGKDCFVPLDGQQRLITLWLLHLYLVDGFNVELFFASREKAADFAIALKMNIAALKEHKNIKNQIYERSAWFVTGWKYDVTVANMVNTLQLIHEKIGGDTTGLQHFDNISFQFLDMKDKGLDDDIYVKMNGRGRPLSYFENLKSWMDEQIEKICKDANKELQSEFLSDWKSNMDNKWTDLFWRNRNTNQEHPEEIDDEQLRFFYSMLLLYWVRKESDFKVGDKSIKENLCAFMEMPNDASDKEIFSKLINILREGKVFIPLYWIEHLKLFDREVFKLINDGLNTLCAIETDINSKKDIEDSFFDLKDSSKKTTTTLYKIAFKEATYEKTLPYLAMLVYVPQKCKEDKMELSRWVRIFKNLILNSPINKDNIGNCISSIESFSLEVDSHSQSEIYALLSSKRVEKSGFKKDQLDEEIEKASQILNGGKRQDGKSWEDIIVEAERCAFFKGAIRFLYRDEQGKPEWTDFDAKWENIGRLIPENESDRHTVKLMLPYLTDDTIRKIFSDRYLSNTDDNLRELLLNFGRETHHFIMQDEESSDRDSLLHQDMSTLCERTPNYLIHKKWVVGLDVLSNYSNRSGYYQEESFVVGSEIFRTALNLLKDSSIKILFPEDTTACGPIKGLYIEFIYKNKEEFKFVWQSSNWVDMYENGENLWDKGERLINEGKKELGEKCKTLHSHYPDAISEEPECFFNDIASLKKELDRCVSLYQQIKQKINSNA